VYNNERISSLHGIDDRAAPNVSGLHAVKHFDWSSVMNVRKYVYDSNLVFHFGAYPHHYKSDPVARRFVSHYMSKTKVFNDDSNLLRYALDCVTIKDGFYIESGTKSGMAINFMAGLLPSRRIFGFTSISGAPVRWDRPDIQFPAGTFALKDQNNPVLPLLKNVTVYQNDYKTSLPIFKKEIMMGSPVAFLHMDTEAYEPTRDTLDELGDAIVPGTIIVFDEFYNYPNAKNHEFKALYEFLKKRGLSVNYIGYNQMHEQVAVKVIRNRTK